MDQGLGNLGIEGKGSKGNDEFRTTNCELISDL